MQPGERSEEHADRYALINFGQYAIPARVRECHAMGLSPERRRSNVTEVERQVRERPTVEVTGDTGFYLRMGARRTGLHESEAVPGRMLPVMEFEVLAAESVRVP